MDGYYLRQRGTMTREKNGDLTFATVFRHRLEKILGIVATNVNHARRVPLTELRDFFDSTHAIRIEAVGNPLAGLAPPSRTLPIRPWRLKLQGHREPILNRHAILGELP